MKEKASPNNILDRVRHNDGMTVPEGYFADFASRMAASLPDRPELDATVISPPRTMWQRVRPYVYMAAMFAGVWCMLKMFTIISAPDTLAPIERNPVIAEAFSNDTFVNDFVLTDLNTYDIYDELMADGIDAQALCDSLELMASDLSLN